MKHKQPLVSVIVTTRNNQETLDACLKSIVGQSYKPIELIVVDNSSSDETLTIAKRYTKHTFTKGPERSAQRNFGVSKAKGEYILIIDSDMEVGPNVVKACVEKVQQTPKAKAIIIPEESFGEGFWAQCKRLERSFYVGVDTIESARFFDKKLYQKVGGYNEQITGGEDLDLTRRICTIASVVRINEYIRHNEGHPRFMRTVSKMYYYGQTAAVFFANNSTSSALTDQSGPLQRYKLFFAQPAKLFKNPITAVGMLTLKTAEYLSGGAGYFRARPNRNHNVQRDSL